MSGLEDLYREVILDHYRKPRNRGRLEVPPATRARGFNSLCGDEIVVYVSVDDDERIAEIATEGHGCAISQASASMMSVAVQGSEIGECLRLTRAFKSMLSIGGAPGGERGPEGSGGLGMRASVGEKPVGEDAAGGSAGGTRLELGELEALKGVLRFPVRIKCATLCWNTLLQALGAELG